MTCCTCQHTLIKNYGLNLRYLVLAHRQRLTTQMKRSQRLSTGYSGYVYHSILAFATATLFLSAYWTSVILMKLIIALVPIIIVVVLSALLPPFMVLGMIGGILWYYIPKWIEAAQAFFSKPAVANENYGTVVDLAENPKLQSVINDLVVKHGLPRPDIVRIGVHPQASALRVPRGMLRRDQRFLILGAGLISSFTVNELTAVIAHELGHFQRHIPFILEPVFIANRILSRLLFSVTTDYDILKSSRNRFTHFFRFTVPKIFRDLYQRPAWFIYRVINSNYAARSRAEEYHVDAVAARVVGGVVLQRALHKTTVAEVAFDTMAEFYSRQLPPLHSTNIFRDLDVSITVIADHIGVQDGRNDVNAFVNAIRARSTSDVVLYDIFASHPLDDERIARLQSPEITSADGEMPARELFTDFEGIERAITAQLFASPEANSGAITITQEGFRKRFIDYLRVDIQHPLFSRYFEFHTIGILELTPDPVRPVDTAKSPTFYFTEEATEQVRSFWRLHSAMSTLSILRQGSISVDHFAFRGELFHRSRAASLLSTLKPEYDSLREAVIHQERSIIEYLDASEVTPAEDRRLLHFCRAIHLFSEHQAEFENRLNTLTAAFEYFTVQRETDDILKHLAEYYKFEDKVRADIRTLLGNDCILDLFSAGFRGLSPEGLKILQDYAHGDVLYYDAGAYNDANVDAMHSAHMVFRTLLNSAFGHLRTIIIRRATEIVVATH